MWPQPIDQFFVSVSRVVDLQLLGWPSSSTLPLNVNLPTAILQDSPKRLRLAAIRPIGGPARAATWAGKFLTERIAISHRADTRVG